ncbi:MAG: hypothetical protein HFJ84_03625 [Clostridiales bacterium]|jgi:hypothetical protein|nr:hypothetical protein [Clostridiales bacterium]
MASIGQGLKQPETEWRRYNDTDSNIVYVGSKWGYKQYPGDTAFCQRDIHFVTGDPSLTEEHMVKLCFEGSKFRIIAQSYTTRTENIQVKIDGEIVDNYSLNIPGAALSFTLCYEKTGLEYGVHTVELLNMDHTKSFIFDAIDIDSSGQLLPFPEESENTLAVLLEQDQTTQLSVSNNLEDNLWFTWKSDNEEIAIVDSQGVVTGVGAGLCRIYVENTQRSYQDSIPVRVLKQFEETPYLAVHLKVRETKRLIVTKKITDNIQFTWTSDNEDVATVDSNGTVTAVKEGLCSIHAINEDGEVGNTIPVRVVPQ